MNKIIMQLWEESEKGWGVRPDGCSLHSSEIERDIYVNNIYQSRLKDTIIPNEYDRIVGTGIDIFVDNILYDKVKIEKSVKITEAELNNLISMDHIIIKKSE